MFLNFCFFLKGSKSPCRVLDLAAGSGIFTKCLLPYVKQQKQEIEEGANDNNSNKVIIPKTEGPRQREVTHPLAIIDELYAVEPAEGMRQEFQVSLPKNVPIVEGTSTHIPFPDNYFDMVTVAQAFHWFANIHDLER